jgi:hypothetical protein
MTCHYGALFFALSHHCPYNIVLRINGFKINLNMMNSRSNQCNSSIFLLMYLFLHIYILLMQHTSLSPDRKVVVIVGDDPDGLLIDANTGKVCHPSH